MSLKTVISVIIPTFNRAGFLPSTLSSIQNQSFEQWECFIIDDGSTDNTLEVIKPFLKDSRFIYLQRPQARPKGANSCRNFGLEQSKSQFIHWMDSDDILHPNCYEISLRYLENSTLDFFSFKRAIFYAEDDIKFDKAGNVERTSRRINEDNLEEILKNEISLNTCNVIWRRLSLEEQRFNETIVYADEWEFYSRLIANGLEGRKIEDILLLGRKHADSTTYEFSIKDKLRTSSKSKAIVLVAQNLKEKKLLSEKIHHYLINQSIGLRDVSALKKLLRVRRNNPLKHYVRYFTYPIWKLTKSKFK